jgi:hypothetical protein
MLRPSRCNDLRQTNGQDGQHSASAFLEVLISRVSVAAVHCAVIASCYNGLESSKTKCDLRSTLDWVPAEPTLVTVIRHETMSDFDTKLDTACCAALESMFSDIERGQELLKSLFQEAQSIGEYRAIVIYLQTLKSTWQASCRNAKAALQSLAKIAVDTDTRFSDKLANLHSVVQLVDEAGKGKWPCLDEAGRATFRGLPSPRLMARYSIGQECTVTVGGRASIAYARDISMAGMGIEKFSQAGANDPLIVELENGRVFSGRIAWISGTSAGIRFDKHLHQNDPLLGG